MTIESIVAIHAVGHAILFNAAMFSRWLAVRLATPTRPEVIAGKVSGYLALYCAVTTVGSVWVLLNLP